MNRTNTVSKPKEAEQASKVIEQTQTKGNAHYYSFLLKGENTMTTNNTILTRDSFKLEFRNKNIAVVFNANEGAKWHNIDNPWEARKIVAALVHILRGTYKVMDDSGLYMKNTWEEMLDGLGSKNEGLMTGKKLQELVDEGKVKYGLDIVPEDTYRLNYDGVNFVGAFHLTYQKWSEGEYESVKHDRNSIYLVKYFGWLAKAARLGANLSLIFPERSHLSYEGMQKKWEAFQAGDFDALNEMYLEGVKYAQTRDTFNRVEYRGVKAAEAGEGSNIEAGEGIPPVGSRIMFFFSETGLDFPGEYRDVTEKNLEGILNAMQKVGLGWKFAPAPVAAKGRNVPQLTDEE